MNAREEGGLVIAAVCKLNQTPDGWLVPSQSGERICRVNVGGARFDTPGFLA